MDEIPNNNGSPPPGMHLVHAANNNNLLVAGANQLHNNGQLELVGQFLAAVNLQQQAMYAVDQQQPAAPPIPDFITNFGDELLVSRAPIHKGSTYDIYTGTFGRIPNVIVKRVRGGDNERENIEKATIEANIFADFRVYSNVVTLLCRDVQKTAPVPYVQLVVDNYGLNLSTYLAKTSVSEEERLDFFDIITQLNDLMACLEVKGILHGELLPKNMFLVKPNGKWLHAK